MKNNFFNFFLLLVLLSVISFSCFEIKPIEVGDIQGVRINKLSGKSVCLDVLLPINNPNTFKFKITGVNLGKVKNIYKDTVPAQTPSGFPPDSFFMRKKLNEILNKIRI